MLHSGYNSGHRSVSALPATLTTRKELAMADATIPLDSDTRQIPLNKDKFAIIDAADYEWLNQWKWITQQNKKTIFYATRTRWNGSGLTTIRMHRLILGVGKGEQVDHINGDGLDNRRCNLRVCSQQENTFNKRKSENKSSKYKGVSWKKQAKKWVARITINRKLTNLGYFNTQESAAHAYNEMAMKYYGEYAKLNDIL